MDLPQGPEFLEKAGRALDLYAGRWEGKLLEPGDVVLSADEKPSIQARKCIHDTESPSPGHGQRVEHEYERLGAICYVDAWDVRRVGMIGRSERKGGIAPFDQLVWQVMTKEPYPSAARVLDRRQRLFAPRHGVDQALEGSLAEPDPCASTRPRQLA